MNPAMETYRDAGLKGIAELYQQFPSRLRTKIIAAQARVWQELWQELVPEEQAAVGEYVLEGDDTASPQEVFEYEAKLQELQQLYLQRHAQRVKEAIQLPPDVAVQDIKSFERAHQELIHITQDLLTQARSRLEEQRLRAEEALQFSGSK